MGQHCSVLDGKLLIWPQDFMDLLNVHCEMMLSINAESKKGGESCGN
jgi:hypothetical protein